jgi:hypothetical protein
VSEHIIPAKALDQHILVLGKTRSGKSSAMRDLVEELLTENKPVCVIDPKGDWWGLKSSADGKHAGYPVVIFGGEHADVPINARSGATIAELIATGNRSCIIDLGGWMPGARTEFFIDFASTFFRLTRGRRYLVIDEVHNFCPQGKVLDPQAGKMLHWSNRIASEGLGKGISLIAASQRPQKVHKDFVTSAETLIAMRVIHPLDRGAIKEWIDGCGDPAKGKEVLETMASLPRGEAWVWSPEIGFGPKRIQFPMFETFDSFKARESQSPAKLKGWADVDLAEITEKLASVVKEAEAVDPKKLKARIAELEKQLRTAPAQKAAPVDQRVIDRAVEAGQRDLADQIFVLQRTLNKFQEFANSIRDATSKALDIPIPFVNSKGPARPRPVAAPVPVRVVSPSRDVAESNGDLKGPHLRILRALAEIRSIDKPAPPKEMVAAWSGYSPNSGGFNNLLGNLRTSEFIQYPNPGLVSLTEKGLNEVGDSPPPDQEEINRRVMAILDRPKQRVLAVLIEEDGRPISKDELAERSGYSSNSGGFNNLLGNLRTAGFAEYPSPKVVKAADWLFVR